MSENEGQQIYCAVPHHPQGVAMNERELITLWTSTRWHIIVSQLAPTFLLAVTIGLLTLGLADASVATRLAAVGILLASGILGAVAQVSSANEGLTIIEDLTASQATTLLASRIMQSAPLLKVVKYITPTVFVLVYAALLAALFLGF
jgi:hypothetical protein